MPFAEQNALRAQIKAATGLEVIVEYDGLKLPSSDKKPFLTIELLNDAAISSTKLRDSVASTNLYQLGIYPQTNRQQRELSAQIKQALLFHDYDGFEVLDNVAIAPIPPEDPSDLVSMHRAFVSFTTSRRDHKQ
ncbi:hypothetical protein [Listeria booriae]|uniref:Uncharacterized protein n=1 Tax=Listeria booriae TaxID=1552123 RepID=A0A7X0TNL0_9LIST|nr:hypothetical protein [Listeria booriae]MBC1331041.1 hypothetical protein [Listeria booriae]MBC2189206.1 hypothetical protein [Listeria booriae]MBC2386351.1 hypothetical protein [Listeria booriae]